MSNRPPDDREKWIRTVREKLEREEAQKKSHNIKSNAHDRDHEDRVEALRQLRLDIGQLNDTSADEEVAAIIDRIASRNDLDELTRDRLLRTIKEQTKTTSLGTLRKQLRTSGGQRDDRRLGHIEGLICEYPGGPPLALESNAIALIRAHPEMMGAIGLDEFRQRSMMMRAPPWAGVRSKDVFPRPTRDADLVELLAWVQRQGIHIKGTPAIRAVLATIVRDGIFHPVRDYLNNLKWDGKPRLDTWLTYYLGVTPVANYTGPAGRMWMISAVARIYQPGCPAKYVLVLTGDQDIGKSSALSILGGEWYTDDIAQLGTKDSQMQVGNAWIVELAELDSMRRANVSTVKAFISRKVDRFRPPYGEHVIDQERQSVLAATVNDAGRYLQDETGNVRFWPVPATKIDLEALRCDRDHLWAEAVHRYKAGERWWPDDEFDPHDAQQEASETAEDDPWFDLIQNWIGCQTAVLFSAREILAVALEVPKERMTRAAEMRVGKIMRKLGYKSKPIRIPTSDKPVRRWVRAGVTGSEENEYF
jgi:predicted P-loop ATPase